jgi:hypothetical protein
MCQRVAYIAAGTLHVQVDQALSICPAEFLRDLGKWMVCGLGQHKAIHSTKVGVAVLHGVWVHPCVDSLAQ